jgi:dethiobiotin synthetase
MFRAPLAPHLAARAEGRRVDAQLLRDGLRFWQETCDVVLVEGAGGLMSPISDDDYNADLAAEFGYPLLVVAANALGTINATLQTLITANTYKKGVRNRFSIRCDAVRDTPKTVPDTFLKVAGVVLNSPVALENDPSTNSNADELAKRCIVPLLATVSHGGVLDHDVDWLQLAIDGEMS